MRRGAGHGDARGSSGISLAGRALAGAALLGLFYGAALALTAPAAVVADAVGAAEALHAARAPLAVEAVSGTVWNGRAALAAPGGLRIALAWRIEPLRSLGRGALSAALRLDGAGIAASGRLLARPGLLRLDAVEGRLDAAPVAGCAAEAALRDVALVWRPGALEAAGTVALAAANCPGIALPPIAVALGADGPEAVATARDAAGRPLGAARLGADGRVALRLEPAGAALWPGAAPGAELLLPLAALFDHLTAPPAR